MNLVYRSKLPVLFQIEYDKYYEALENGEPSFLTKLSPHSINHILFSVLNDHPELFWFEGKWKYDRERIYPVYCETRDKQYMVEREVNSVLECLNNVMNGTSVPQRIAGAYRFILKEVSYDISAPNGQNSYGAIIQKRAVCKGISKYYQIIMQEMGIPCTILKGTIDGVSSHVWNIVFVNGSWRHVDVSMGYSQFGFMRDLLGRGDLSFCCLSDEEIRETHSW